MDALSNICEAILTNDWVVSSIKLALVPILCISIGKSLDIIKEGIANAYWEG